MLRCPSPLIAAPVLLATLAALAALAPAAGGAQTGRTEPPAAAEEALSFGPWWCLGPFDEPAGGASLATVHPPERALLALAAGDAGPELGERYRGKGGAELRWSKLPSAQAEATELDVGRIDLIAAAPPPPGVEGGSTNVVAYLYRRIECARATRLDLSLGSDDGLRLWLDGQLLIDRPVTRSLSVRDHSLSLSLSPGTHHLVAKVAQEGGGWAFEMRRWTRVPQEAIDAAIDRGVGFLLGSQLLDGSWPTHEDWGAGHAAFALYTLLKCGLPPSHAAVRRAAAYVHARPPTTTYAAATQLLALAELGDGRSRAGMEHALALLVDFQESNGRFGYPRFPTSGRDHGPDVSNMLFAAMALRAAGEAGLRVPEKTWRQLIEGTLAWQERPPRNAPAATGGAAPPLGFPYRGGGQSTGSMTTAGITILAIAREQLGTGLPAAVAHRVEPAIQAGLSWLEKHGRWTSNPVAGGHHYYYVYGLERVGALLGRERLAGCTWYWDGAEVLVKAQGASGSWQSVDRKEYDDTLLALLFLKRATHASTGGKAARSGVYATAESDEGADVLLRATGDADITVWIEAFSEGRLAELEWPGEAGRGPRVARVEFLARYLEAAGAAERSLGEQPGHETRPAAGARFAVRAELDRPGRWALRARVHALAPPRGDALAAEPRLLESPELVVRVENVLAPGALRYAAEGLRNLLLAERRRMESSSEAGDDRAARHASDGRQGTSWLCAPDDAEPWVRIFPERPVRATRLSLSHAEVHAEARGRPRAHRVEILINGRDAFPLELDPDPQVKTDLLFERIQRVRRIDVRVLESLDRTLGTDGVGFAEIELFLDR